MAARGGKRPLPAGWPSTCASITPHRARTTHISRSALGLNATRVMGHHASRRPFWSFRPGKTWGTRMRGAPAPTTRERRSKRGASSGTRSVAPPSDEVADRQSGRNAALTLSSKPRCTIGLDGAPAPRYGGSCGASGFGLNCPSNASIFSVSQPFGSSHQVRYPFGHPAMTEGRPRAPFAIRPPRTSAPSPHRVRAPGSPSPPGGQQSDTGLLADGPARVASVRYLGEAL